MAKIYYGISGSGRGHLTRSSTISSYLTPKHDVFIYSFGAAFKELAGTQDFARVRKIPGIDWQYSNGKVSLPKTFASTIPFLAGLENQIKLVIKDIERDKPDLIITDFEPILPRAAERVGVPYISIDHQSIFTTSNFEDLPPSIKFYAWGVGEVVKQYYNKQREAIVSSFFFPPIKSGMRNVTQAGVLLGQEILEAQPEREDYVLAYFKDKQICANALDALKNCGTKVIVYGLGNLPAENNVQFCGIDRKKFTEDLIRCRAVVCTAGNQLIGESAYLGKPIYTFPESGNKEQALNAYYVNKHFFGQAQDIAEVSSYSLRNFLSYQEFFTPEVERAKICGNFKILNIINKYL